jgi:hypothetical protein
MPKRRSLADRIKSTPKADPTQAAAFIYGDPKRSPAPPTTGPGEPSESPTPAPALPSKPVESSPKRVRGKWPISTTVRDDIGDALKRASLMRQLEGVTPNTIQDIIELVLEPWLKANGYLK